MKVSKMEEGFTADFSDRDKNTCITNPPLIMNYEGNYRYSVYNLDSRCNCGKTYGEHPHFVEHNREIEAEIRQKVLRENEAEEKFLLESTKRQFNTYDREPIMIDRPEYIDQMWIAIKVILVISLFFLLYSII